MFALLAILATLHLTAKSNNHRYTVKPQSAIVVTLPSNRSTGYRWEVVYTHGRGRHLAPLSDRYVAPSKARPGAGGKEILRFRAPDAGSAVIWLRYVRPSAPNKPARLFGVGIRVR